MKKILFVAAITIISAISVFAQTEGISMNKSGKTVKEILLNLEKRMWQARKDRDDKHLSILTTEDAINVVDFGTISRTAILQNAGRAQCQISRFIIEDASVKIFNVTTALLIYKTKLESICDAKTVQSQFWSSSLYVRHNGNWLNAFHQETPAGQLK